MVVSLAVQCGKVGEEHESEEFGASDVGEFPRASLCSGQRSFVFRYVLANRYITHTGNDSIERRRVQFRNLKLPQQSGFVFESYHVESYNKNAIAQGKPFRAELTKHGSAADVVIKEDVGQVVLTAQMKRYSSARETQKAFRPKENKSKYEGMAWIGPGDHAGGGVESSLKYGGVESDPISLHELDELTGRGGHLTEVNVTGRAWCEVRQACAAGFVLGAAESALFELFDFLRCDRHASQYRWSVISPRRALRVAREALLGAVTGGVLQALTCGLSWRGLDLWFPMAHAVGIALDLREVAVRRPHSGGVLPLLDLALWCFSYGSGEAFRGLLLPSIVLTRVLKRCLSSKPVRSTGAVGQALVFATFGLSLSPVAMHVALSDASSKLQH